MSRRAWTIALVVAGVLFVLPASASAMSYVCVGSNDARCNGENYSMNKAGLSLAAMVADFEVAHWGPTTILIGPGTLDIDYDYGDSNIAVGAPIDFTQSTALTDGALPEELHIVGAGAGLTTIKSSNVPCCGSYEMLKFDTTSWPAGSISDLRIENSGITTNETALEMSGGTVEDVDFRAFGGFESPHRSLQTTGNELVTVKNANFEVIGTFIQAVAAGSPLDISDSTISSSAEQDEQFGIDATDDLTARRLKIIGMMRGIRASGDDTRIDDTLVRINRLGFPASSPGGTASGVEIWPVLPDGESANARLRGLTIYGDAQNQVGLSVKNLPPTPRTTGVSFNLEDSLISLTGADTTEFTCAGSGNSQVAATLFYSMFSTTAFPGFPAVGCPGSTVSVRDRLAAPPQFVDAANDDFRALAGSSVIDAGSDDSDRTPPKLDLAQNPRFVDGNSDGSSIIDIGAFEFQPTPASTPGPNPSPGATTTPLVLSFGKPVGKFKLKNKPKSFTFTTVKKKPRLPVTSNRATPVELTLARAKAGYKSGSKCVAKKPRPRAKRACDIALRGKLALQLPAGTSYLTFSGKWNKKKLRPGKYALTLRAAGSKDSIKSVLSIIR
jgi:hypothetical protein